MQSYENQCKNYEDLQSELTQLQRENFQLKLRIHLTETRGVADPITTTTPKRLIKDTETDKECESLKVEKEQLEIKLRQEESLLLHEIKLKEEIIEREGNLTIKYNELKTQLELLEREKNVSRLRQCQGSNPNYSSLLTSVPKSIDQISMSIVGNLSECSSLTNLNHDAQEWFQKYEEERKNCQILEIELSQLGEELKCVNNERQVLMKQLNTSETVRKKEFLVMDNRLKEMRIALDKADERSEALRNRSVNEMSNQLIFHQIALEKVHKEQGLLIAELQSLKRSCPFKIQTALKLCNEIEDEEVEAEALPQFIGSGGEKMSRKNSASKMNIIEDYNCKWNNGIPSSNHDPKGSLCLKEGRRYDDDIAHVNRKLHEKNSKLALKLKKTREGMRACISMLEYSEKDKAGMEKIICRQLHKTHTILTQVTQVKETLVQSKGTCSSPPSSSHVTSTPVNCDVHVSSLTSATAVN